MVAFRQGPHPFCHIQQAKYSPKCSLFIHFHSRLHRLPGGVGATQIPGPGVPKLQHRLLLRLLRTEQPGVRHLLLPSAANGAL
jgi:hypothetical protein